MLGPTVLTATVPSIIIGPVGLAEGNISSAGPVLPDTDFCENDGSAAGSASNADCINMPPHVSLYTYKSAWKSIPQGSGFCFPSPIPHGHRTHTTSMLLSRAKTNSKQFHTGFSFRKRRHCSHQLQSYRQFSPDNCKAPALPLAVAVEQKGTMHTSPASFSVPRKTTCVTGTQLLTPQQKNA